MVIIFTYATFGFPVCLFISCNIFIMKHLCLSVIDFFLYSFFPTGHFFIGLFLCLVLLSYLFLDVIFYLKYFPGLTFSCSNTCCLLILTPSSSCLFFMVFLTATGDVFIPWITCVHLFLVDTEETWQEEPVDGR